MRTLILSILMTSVTLFLHIQEVKAQNHPLLNSDYIPMMGLHHSGYHGINKIQLYPKLQEMGLEGVIFGDVTQDMFSGFSGINDNMKLMPYQIHDPINYIFHYTSAVYTIWQAHDTTFSPLKAALQYDTTLGERISGNTIRTKPLAEAGNLITGPGYNQSIRYRDDGTWNSPLIDYAASFHLKIEQNEQYPDPPQSTEGLTDTLCVLKVVVKEIGYNNGFYFKDSLVWRELPVLVNQLEFGEWEKFDFDYDYSDLPINFKNVRDSTKIKSDEYIRYSDTSYADFVEYCIEWKGVDYARLYFDTLLVSDERGRNLFNPDNPTVRNLIRDQANNTGNGQGFNVSTAFFENTVVGFYGQDEPGSIDNLEPVRKVGELMREATNGQRPLFISIAMSWNGRWNDSGFGIQPLDHNQEFYNRAQPDGFFMQSGIYQTDELGTIEQVGSQIWTIQRSYIPNLRSLQHTAPMYSVLVRTAKWLPDGLVDPSPEQLRFSVYLALMYGSKGIFFDQVFVSNENIGGIINPFNNPPTYSPLYDEIKDNIYPRTSGWFGKTLNQIHQTEQYSNLALPTGSYNYISSINYNPGEGSHPPNVIDLGFFEKDNVNYFMLLNRYYYTAVPTDSLVIHIDKSNGGYINWNVTNFIDSTVQTIIEEGDLKMPRILGDCRLFKVHPVVLDGGSLVVSETTHPNDVLFGDMSIENGATLTVNGTYYAKANITVKSGGKIITGPNGKIIFDPNKSITVEGNAEIKGFTNNKLSLEFSNSTAVGVEAQFGSNLSISNCIIKNAIVGIKVENGSTANISYVDFTDCSDNAVVMFGFGNGENAQSLPTPTVYRCTIENSSTGISVVNCDQLVLKENTINHCNLGIFLNMVNSAYITSNTILGWQSATGSPMPGISISNGGGYIRNNIIRYHNFGVLLAYASPDLGVNTIENNYKCGVYSSIGSFPNLVQQLANPQCWYPIGGCNVIRNNGTFTYLPPSTPEIQPDGAEIFLNSGDVLLSYGYNEISDDRTGIPTYLTIPLIKGTRSRGGSKEFFVDHNYWGIVGPSPLRFGTLNAVYEPGGYYCPLPDMPCSGGELVIQTTDGQIVDTLDSRERETTEISALEENYAMADKLFYSGEIEESKTYYLTIIQGSYTNAEKLYAYNKLYEIGELLKEGTSYFTELQNALNSIIEVETDTLLLKAFNQQSILCDVGKEEYLTAISKFDNIIQQNPNSEEAIYAEIDIITTALNLDTTNSHLGKMGNGKYLVKGTSDYLSKLNDILQSKFGVNSKEKEQIIPKEYSLYQNYPNPFNPTTTIKFDLPNDGLVQLEIFDILGRRIVSLLEEYKTAGSYEQVFNASSLASGVYVYKLQAGDFVSSKKMILLK